MDRGTRKKQLVVKGVSDKRATWRKERIGSE